mgnify:CR=1 FL=1
MGPSEAKEFFKFVTSTLPNLLSAAKDPLEALEGLGTAWKANRTHDIKDRSKQVAANRSNVDDVLAARREAESKKTAPKKKTTKKSAKKATSKKEN